MARTFLGRCVRWSGEGYRLETPNILFLNDDHLSPPFAEVFLEAGDEPGAEVIGSNTGARMAEIEGGTFVPLSIESRLLSEEGRAEGTPSQKELGDLVVMPHSFELRRDARSFVQHMRALRGAVGPSKLIYAPGIMDVSNLALLAYMGVDLFDSALVSYLARKGSLSLPEGTIS
ncbi:MAG TPA: hypothetical protein VLU38_00690, partial [Methanomassiliicoccales archaeon]|nr:hypothetical protein [Methanomassiliicoccales archaeon]